MVYVKDTSDVHHRDPGCARLFVNAGVDNPARAFSTPPPCTRPCFYCYSPAGYRRYP